MQVVDATSHRLLKSIPTQAPEGVAAQGKYVFVTNNDGFLSRIDTASLAVDLQTAVGPNPAGVLALNNYIYVAISDGYNYNDGYKNGFKVLKVRPNTLGIVSEIRVGMNPTKLYKDDFNHVFVACQGNYGTHAAEIWKINENDEATSFAAGQFRRRRWTPHLFGTLHHRLDKRKDDRNLCCARHTFGYSDCFELRTGTTAHRSNKSCR